MTEVWAPITDYVGRYEISNIGRVRSLRKVSGFGNFERKNPLIMKPMILRNGYLAINLQFDKRCKVFLIHRLVLTMFYGPCPAGMECAHLDGDRKHNRIENLIWATRKQNHSHKILHGTDQRGERCAAAKLTEHQVQIIRYRRNIGKEKLHIIADDYGITFSLVSKIAKFHVWKQLPFSIVGIDTRGRT